MECEICGREGKLTLVSIRNAKMWVCPACKSYGTEVPKHFAPNHTKKVITLAETDEEYFDFVDNYTSILRNARNKMNLTHEEFGKKINESVSLIKKIESGKIKPTQKQTKKLEKFLNVKLYGKVEL